MTVKLRGEFLQFFSQKNCRKTGRELLLESTGRRPPPRPPKSRINIWRRYCAQPNARIPEHRPDSPDTGFRPAPLSR